MARRMSTRYLKYANVLPLRRDNVISKPIFQSLQTVQHIGESTSLGVPGKQCSGRLPDRTSTHSYSKPFHPSKLVDLGAQFQTAPAGPPTHLRSYSKVIAQREICELDS